MSDSTATVPQAVLLADIGATNARFVRRDGRGGEHTAVLRCADHASLEATIRTFLEAPGREEAHPWPTRGAIAVAAPVVGDLVAFTNRPWQFSIRELRCTLGLERLVVVNDFAAVARGVPGLAPHDRRQIAGGLPEPGAAIAVLGPGSGLGVSGLLPAGDGAWTVLSGEGGHVTMAPATDRESEVLAFLRRRFGHVSAERVLSGPGLVNLHQALSELEGLLPAPMTAAEITAAALAGTNPHCLEALHMFAALLGTVAGNLALTLGARGGVYIAGGIVPRLGPFLETSAFRRRFTDKGPQSRYLAPIPTYLITHPLPAFPGLDALLASETPR